MGKFIDLTGKRFSRLTVIRRNGTDRRGNVQWLCICDCGNEKIVTSGSLRAGFTQSCGCLFNERFSFHKKCDAPEYSAWRDIIQRCNNPKSPIFKYYGERGIEVCERWHKFDNFYADMGDKPSPKHSIDRIDVNGNYEPSNCKWATQKEQAINKRTRKDNKSGHPGVCWNKAMNKWQVLIAVDGKRIYLGCFEKIEDAIEARKQAEMKYWNKQPS